MKALRYFILSTLAAAGCSIGASPAISAEATAPKIIVFLVWVNDQHEVEYTEYATEADSPAECRGITVTEMAKHISDFEALKSKGLHPHLACGISVPDKEFYEKGGASKDKAESDDDKHPLMDLDCPASKQLVAPQLCGKPA